MIATNVKQQKNPIFKELIIQYVTELLTIYLLIISFVSLLVVILGSIHVRQLEQQYPSQAIVSVQEQRLSVKEMADAYISSLEVPEELLLKEPETSVQTIEMMSDTLFTSEIPFGINVDGITPTIEKFNVSAYCSCEKCCGKVDGITASGDTVKEWCTIAAGKKYELGTVIYIPDLANMPNGGWFIVQDRGGAISNERLDIYLSTHQKALEFGRQYLECYIYEKED